MTLKPPHVSVIIVAFKAKPLIARTLAQLNAQTFTDFEAIALDNASPDGPPDLPDDSRFRLIRNPVNAGFAGGNNLAAAGARGTWLALLNPDAFPEPDWLEQLLAAAERHPDAAMVGSLQLAAERPGFLDGAGDCYHASGFAWRGLYGAGVDRAPPTGEVFAPCAAAALYRADLFGALGGFDEDFFCYHEDVDLAFRLRLAGWRCVQSREARVAHVGSASTGRASDFAVFHGARNRLWTFAKTMPLPLLILLVPAHAAVSLLVIAQAARKGVLTATVRGMAAGLEGLPAVWRKRAAVQRTRRVSLIRLLGAFTWSPLKMVGRDGDVRPWRQTRRR